MAFPPAINGGFFIFALISYCLFPFTFKKGLITADPFQMNEINELTDRSLTPEVRNLARDAGTVKFIAIMRNEALKDAELRREFVAKHHREPQDFELFHLFETSDRGYALRGKYAKSLHIPTLNDPPGKYRCTVYPYPVPALTVVKLTIWLPPYIPWHIRWLRALRKVFSFS